MKKITKRTFFCLILFFVLVGIGGYLFKVDIERRNIKLTSNNIKIVLSEDKWTKDDVELSVNYTGSKDHIKEYSFDNAKTWTKNNHLTIKKNQDLKIRVKDVNDKIFKIDYKVHNIDREGPIILINDPIQVSRYSKVDLKDFVTYYDEKSGIRDEVVVTPPTINTNALGTYSFWVYTIDNLANKTITKMNVEVVPKAPVVMATTVSIERHNLSINVNEEYLLTVNVGPKNAINKKVTWTSSDPSIVSVDIGGKVTGLKKGSATISAVTTNNVRATCVVIVK